MNFEAFYARWKDYWFRWIMRDVKDEHLANEILQNAAGKMFAKRAQCSQEDRRKAWANKIVAREICNATRKTTKAQKARHSDEQLNTLAAHDGNPLVGMINAEECDRLEIAISALTVVQQDILRFRMEGKKHKDIRFLVGLSSESDSRHELARILTLLRSALTNYAE